MPSVRDLKGNILVEDAAPVMRPARPPDPPAVLPEAALEAKRRLEQRSGVPRPETAQGAPAPATRPPAPPVPHPVADLTAGLTALDHAIAAVATEIQHLSEALDDLREASEKLREIVAADGEQRVQLAAVREMLGKVLGPQ